jgi:hypothetical protein
LTVHRRTVVERAVSYLRRLNEPARKAKKIRVAPTLRAQVAEEFREAQRRRA